MSYNAKFWLWAVLAFGTAALVGVALGYMVPFKGGVENPALVLPLVFLALGLVMLVVWVWWQRTDELQQQGQLVSWYWGGNAGAMIMLAVLVVLTGRHSDMSVGAGYLFFAQFAGFLAVWLAWKFHGRGAAE